MLLLTRFVEWPIDYDHLWDFGGFVFGYGNDGSLHLIHLVQ
jgi:hypothetical protein